eukprot:3338318-Amphidinium_carterae.3
MVNPLKPSSSAYPASPTQKEDPVEQQRIRAVEWKRKMVHNSSEHALLELASTSEATDWIYAKRLNEFYRFATARSYSLLNVADVDENLVLYLDVPFLDHQVDGAHVSAGEKLYAAIKAKDNIVLRAGRDLPRTHAASKVRGDCSRGSPACPCRKS